MINSVVQRKASRFLAMVLVAGLGAGNAYAIPCDRVIEVFDPDSGITSCVPNGFSNCDCPAGYTGSPTCQPDANPCSGNERCDTSSCTPPHVFVNLNFSVSNSNGQPVSGALVRINGGNDLYGNGATRTTNGSGFANFGVWTNTSNPYTVSATGYNGKSGTANVGTGNVTVNVTLVPVVVPPSVTTHPADQSVVAGQTATFSVNAANETAHQWQRADPGSSTFNAIAGATSGSYTTPAATVAGDNGARYRCVVSNSAGSDTSNAATLTVTAAPAAPVITTQPSDGSVTAGQTASFNVAATGATGYLWQRADPGSAAFNPISGAVSASYTTPATVIAQDNGARYRCVVSNSVGSVTSNAATLTVTAAPAAPVITTQPSDRSVTVGQTASFNVAATGATGYLWQRAGPGSAAFNPISGAVSASYTTPATVIAQDNGARYRCVVSNSVGSVTSNAATLTVTNGATPVITSALTATARVGDPFSYQITATNSPTSFSAAPVPLPAGLALNSSGGISGTPNAAGVFDMTLSAANSFGAGAPATLRLTVAPAAQAAASNISAATAFPVPFKPGSGNSFITFNNLMNDPTVTIKIYTITGELVKELRNDAAASSLPWNVRNTDGAAVASGVYIYQIKNAASEKRGKLVISR